jgi:hypothetical protein
MSPLELMGTASIAVGVAGNCVALVYIRLAQVQLRRALAVHQEMAERLYSPVPSADNLLLPLVLPMSLKCRIYGNAAHAPCSGTRDDGSGDPCECWCHKVPQPRPARA